MQKYMKLIRVRHYVKNLLIFAALACSGQFFDGKKLLDGMLGFMAFCLISSVVYIINDIRDREKDRKHPTKCKRPIAAGTITVRKASVLACAFLVAAIICNSAVFYLNSSVLLALYLIINLAYSFGLKNVPLLDISILVAGFLIRILYGAIITEITVSNWLYLTVLALAFYFALGKRRNELRKNGSGETRAVLKVYPINFLDRNMYMALTLTNVFYALWSADEKTIASYDSNYLVFTVPLVMLITMKYSLDIEGDSEGDPVEVLMKDKVLSALCVLYLLIMFAILYL